MDSPPESPEVRTLLPSLEHQCFMYLIANLDNFPPESLGYLPANIRYTLLKNLPVVDILQLENTPVTNGLDVNVGVWRHVFTSRLPIQVRNQLESVCPGYEVDEPDWKECFFFCLSTGVLNNHFPGLSTIGIPELYSRQAVEEALFSLPECFELDYDDYPFQHPFVYTHNDMWCTPRRYEWIRSHTAQSRSDLQLLHILMTKCKYLPEYAYIIGEQFMSAELWTSRCSTNLLCEFLSQVTTFEFVSTLTGQIVPHTAISNMPQFIIEMLLSCKKPCLQSIHITGGPHFMMAALYYVSHLLAEEDKSTTHRHSFQSVYKEMISNIPYSGLHSIAVHMHDDQSPLAPIVVYSSLLDSIMCNQILLKRLHLDSWPSGHFGVIQPINAISVLLSQPQFECLQVEQTTLHVNVMKSLIATFLLPTHSRNGRTLWLNDIGVLATEFSTSTTLFPPIPEAVSVSPQEDVCKELALINLMHNGVPIDPLLNWLGNYPHLRLKSLQLYNVGTTENLLGCFSSNPHSQIEHFHIGDEPIHPSPSLPTDFEALFHTLHVESVTLDKCNIGPEGLLPALTHGLRKQTSVQTLQNLSLGANDLGQCPSSDLQAFFDVVFSLPKLEELSLDLEDNGFNVGHFRILCNCYSQSSRGKQSRLNSLAVGEALVNASESVPELHDVCTRLYECIIRS